MTLANCSGRRCSRLRTSKPLTPYSASPDRPRRPYFSRTARRRTSPGHLDGQLDHVEQVLGKPRTRQHPAHRRGVDGAHVDHGDLDPVPPSRAGLPHPVRRVIDGASLDLPQQALIPGQVDEAGMPPVREKHILPAVLIGPPAGPAAAVLIDPQIRHRRHRRDQHRIGAPGEGGVRRRAVAQTACVRVARQPDASAAAAAASRTVSRMSCSGQYWLAGW